MSQFVFYITIYFALMRKPNIINFIFALKC